MKRRDLLTVTLVAMATALLTLTLALPAQLNAVDPTKPKPENQTPKLTVDGVVMSLKVISHGDLTKGPSLELVAMNTTQTKASIKSTVAMLDRNDQMPSISRVGPAEEPSYSSEQSLELSAGQTRTFKIDTNKPVGPGHSVRFTLTAKGNAMSVAGFNTPGPVNNTQTSLVRSIANALLSTNGNVSVNAKAAAPASTTQPSAVPVAQKPTAKSAS